MKFSIKSFKTITRSSIKNIIKRKVSFTSDRRILGIETSCDDTGLAIVNGSGNILGESLYSQNRIHVRYGGVNPVIAHELHHENIEKAMKETLTSARLNLEDIDAIAVTTKPGLPISLQVGVKYARYISKIMNNNIPLIPIHHMEAHALVARMYGNIPFPYIVLLISGGHALLAIVHDVNNFVLLGETLDNAPGQILDKAARRMKLRNIPEFVELSGGRAIELAARLSKTPDLFQFTMPLMKYRNCNFSFSGLKNSLEKKLFQKEKEHNIEGDQIIPEVYDLCAGLQLAIAEHLANRTERAVIYCEKLKLIGENKNIVVSGGVACNNFIFNSIKVIGKKFGYNVIRPPPSVCTDNGVMIAWNGIEKIKNNHVTSDVSLSDIEAKAPLGVNVIEDVMNQNIPVKTTKLINLYNK